MVAAATTPLRGARYRESCRSAPVRPWLSPRHHRPLAKPRVPAPLRM